MSTHPILHKLSQMMCVVGLLLIGGTLGYALIERWALADGLYMTIITLSTVGYGETHELSPIGRWFTIGLIVISIGTMAGFTAMLTSVIVEDELSGQRQHRKFVRIIAKMKDHIIVCGSDMMAQAIVEQLVRKRQSLVVIDDQIERLERLRKRFRKVPVLEGKATDELKLAEANVMSARAVVAAMDSEVDNLLVGISCKALAVKLSVYARANDATLANSMRKAGIDAVVSPSQLCGNHVVGLIQHQGDQTPSVAERHPQPPGVDALDLPPVSHA